MSRLRSIAGEARARLKVRLRRGTTPEQLVYHLVFSDAYRRERRTVSRGNQEYWRLRQAGRLEFLLRRNIHMAEKGLTMRPRRNTFALAYIEETVQLAHKLLKQDPPIISSEVENWTREVLTRYFDATSESDEAAIVRSRQVFATLPWTNPEGDPASGPHPPASSTPPVTYDALLDLAKRRKSVRWFAPQPVNREDVDRAMLVAAEAPSACNRQPFSFRIFDDPEMVAKVAAIPMGTAGYAHNLPAIAAIVGDLSAFIDERDRHLIYTDGCLAAMSFILALETQNIASVCINWPDIAERERRMARLLNLQPHERVVMLIGFGHADPSGDTPFSAKRSLHQLREYNRLS